MTWLSGWAYRRKITISGASGAGTNYQVLLKVGESSGATGCHFHLDGLSANFPSGKNQGGDLRFTADDGVTLLSFWVEDVRGASPNRIAYVWVKISADLGTNQDIYCYFGNPSATNASSGDQTFLFFDDFEGTSLDTTKWLLARWVGSGSYSAVVSNGYVRINAGSNTTAGIVSKVGFSFPFAVGGLYRKVTDLENWHGIVQNPAGTDIDFVRHGYSQNSYYYQKNTSGNLSTYQTFSRTPPSSFTRIQIIWGPTSSQYFEADSQVNTVTTQDRWSGGTNYLQFFEWSNGTADYDYIFVRKYVSPEPAFSSAGSIQTLSSWLQGWRYRRLVTISGSPGAGTGYQVLLKIGESSGATGCHFYLDGKSASFPSGKNQGGDLRFTDANGQTLFPFWIEKVEGTSPNRVAYVWVKVLTDLSTSQSIYCYFGNPSATNASDGNATFYFFDDFDGTSLDSTKWVAYANDYSISNSILRINVGGVERTSAFPFNLQNGYIAEVRVRHEVSAADYGGVLPEVASSPYTAGLNANSDATILFMREKGANTAYVWIGTGSTNSYDVTNTASTGWTPATGTWYVTGISINGGTVRLWADGAAIYTVSSISWAKNMTYVKLGSFHRDSSYDIQDTSYDWVRVRKYVSPEPAFSSAGGIQVPSSSRRLFLMPI